MFVDALYPALPAVTVGVMAVVLVAAVVVLPRGRAAQHGGQRGVVRGHVGDEDFRVAAAQLDAEDPALRLPAVRALEEMAQAHPAYRQPVVDLWCACLRRPPDDRDGVVRRAAQHALAAHVVPTDRERYWGVVDIDLAGAVLADLDLSRAVVGRLACRRARFEGETILRGARILGPAVFTGARFEGPLHSADVDFEQTVDFVRTCCTAEATFARCTFRGDAQFAAALFGEATSFAGSIFLAGAVFSDPVDGHASFGGFADFRHACFGAAQFAEVDFPAGADFDRAEFARLLQADRVDCALRTAAVVNLP